jgi:hypothetical protein
MFVDARCSLLPISVWQAAVKRRVTAMAIRPMPVSGRATVIGRPKFYLVPPIWKAACVWRIPAVAPRAAPPTWAASASRACRTDCNQGRPNNEGARKSKADT